MCDVACTSAGTPRSLAAGELELIHRGEDRRAIVAQQWLQLAAERCSARPHVRSGVAFDHDDPGGDLGRFRTPFLLGGLPFADRLVGETEMDARDTLVVGKRRQQALPQCAYDTR